MKLSKKQKGSKPIPLPKTLEEFDQLVELLVKSYKLPDHDHAASVVANRIQHLPVDQATITMDYLANCVLKHIAYGIAQHKLAMMQHKNQIDMIASTLKENRLDQQARDALEKACNDGSDYAKQKYEELFPNLDTIITREEATIHTLAKTLV